MTEAICRKRNKRPLHAVVLRRGEAVNTERSSCGRTIPAACKKLAMSSRTEILKNIKSSGGAPYWNEPRRRTTKLTDRLAANPKDSMPKKTYNKPASATLKRRKPVQCSAGLAAIVRKWKREAAEQRKTIPQYQKQHCPWSAFQMSTQAFTLECCARQVQAYLAANDKSSNPAG